MFVGILSSYTVKTYFERIYVNTHTITHTHTHTHTWSNDHERNSGLKS
jgi:hypothetical protein